MIINPKAYHAVPVGVVIRRQPGVTRWQKWTWKVTDLLPGANNADWRVLRQEGDVTEYHAATVPLELHGAESEAYHHGLHTLSPSLYVVLRESMADIPFDVMLVTASPYEAQDYTDSGEEIVEKVPMSPAMRGMVQEFVDQHYEPEEFIKRKRDKKRIDLMQDGIGDPRIGTASDVYASPELMRRRMQ